MNNQIFHSQQKSTNKLIETTTPTKTTPHFRFQTYNNPNDKQVISKLKAQLHQAICENDMVSGFDQLRERIMELEAMLCQVRESKESFSKQAKKRIQQRSCMF